MEEATFAVKHMSCTPYAVVLSASRPPPPHQEAPVLPVVPFDAVLSRCDGHLGRCGGRSIHHLGLNNMHNTPLQLVRG